MPLFLADDFTPPEEVTGAHILPAGLVNPSFSFASITSLTADNQILSAKTLFHTVVSVCVPVVHMCI